jgi:DNA polymerase III delta prime subunit
MLDFLETYLGIKKRGDPDLHIFDGDTFGIDDSRQILESHSMSSMSTHGKKIFIVSTSSLTSDSQNALLKIVEEPTQGTHIFLIIPSRDALLPTLRSRLSFVDLGDVANTESTDEKDNRALAKRFLKMSKKERIEFVDDMAKEIADEDLPKSVASELVSAIAEEVRGDRKALSASLKALDYMRDRSASVKQLLEYVALRV